MVQRVSVGALRLVFAQFAFPERFDGATTVARPTRIDQFWQDSRRKEARGRASP